jgi:D-psicose/D-tagatose/L-ribulose 3-epimerase
MTSREPSTSLVSALVEHSSASGPTLGAHLFLWAASSATAELDRAIAAARALGMDFVQVSLSSLDDLDVAAVRESLTKHRMDCLTGLAVPVTVWERRRDGALLSYLRRAVDATADLGSHFLSGSLYTPMGERGGPGHRREELDRLRSTLKEVAKYAASLGVRLGLEPMNRYETSLVNTCQQMVDLINEIDEPNVLVHLDTFHMNIEEQDLSAALLLAGERLGYVQLAESDRGVPGDGHLPWASVFAGLRDLSYRGPLAFESFTSENRVLAAAGCLWRDVVGDPDDFVTRGWQQLRAKAQLVGYAM